MKIYTKTGDKGMTSLYGGTRVSKFHSRIEAYGTVDELNSYLGLIRSQPMDDHSINVLVKLQHNLFTIGSVLATPPDKAKKADGSDRLQLKLITNSDIELLEKEMDAMNEQLPEMNNFVLPGGNTIVSFCHIARCVCRRAERIVALLGAEEPLDPIILIYLNRLSDYLFVLARKLTYDNQVQEIPWIPEKNN